MTVQELNNNFDLISDRVGSPYFTAQEKEYFFNTAQYAIIDELLYPALRPGATENDIFDFHKARAFEQGLGPLTRTVSVTAAANQTVIPFDTLNNNLGHNAVVYKVINFLVQDNAAVSATTYNSAKHVRNIQSATALYAKLRTFNAFTTAGRTAIYTIQGVATGATSGTTNKSRIEFFPAATANNVYQVEVVICPRPISIASGVNPEIDIMFHNDLLFRALTLGGISTRDAQLAQGAQAMEVAQ